MLMQALTQINLGNTTDPVSIMVLNIVWYHAFDELV